MCALPQTSFKKSCKQRLLKCHWSQCCQVCSNQFAHSWSMCNGILTNDHTYAAMHLCVCVCVVCWVRCIYIEDIHCVLLDMDWVYASVCTVQFLVGMVLLLVRHMQQYRCLFSKENVTALHNNGAIITLGGLRNKRKEI